MGWAFGSGIQIRIEGTILQELKDQKCKTQFIEAACILDELKRNSEFTYPDGKRNAFFMEFKYYIDLTSSGIFSLVDDMTFIEILENTIFENKGISSPVDMFKVLLLLNTFRKLNEQDIWFGIGNSDGCLLFGAFYKNKLDYIKVKKSKSDELADGNAFTCTKKEMELFFSEPHTSWFVPKN